MKNLTLVLLSVFVTSCFEPNVSGENLKEGDSLFVDKDLHLSVYSRVHRTNSQGFQDGHAQVDSNRLESTTHFLNRQFFFNREHTFVGTFEKSSQYDDHHVILKYISPDIKKEILKDKEHFGKKIVADRKKFFSGEIRKGVILENFPDELYFDLKELNNAPADSVIKF